MPNKSSKIVRNRERGASILEVVVAVVIGLLVLAGVYKIFQSNSQSYRTQEAAARIQENGRLAVELLSRDIRMTGYKGCTLFGDTDNVLNNATRIEFDFDRAIEGYDNIDSSNLPVRVSDALDPNDIDFVNSTDIVVVRVTRSEAVPIVEDNTSTQLFAYVSGNQANGCPDGSTRVSGLCSGDLLMVSDCTKSRVFQTGVIQNVSGILEVDHPASGDPGNDSSLWGGTNSTAREQFGEDSEIMKVSTLIYFVAENDRGVPTLYLKESNLEPVELVEGVENMQVLYGVDTGGSPEVDAYVPAYGTHDNTNWTNVRSVRLALLLRSSDEIGGGDVDTNTYDLLGTSVGPMNDRHIRRVVNTTIAIRNRLQ
ncbi:MAG: PilW family protein [Desulfovibrionales bacterium]